MKNRPTILVVSHNLQNIRLLADFLDQLGYGAQGAAGLDELDTILGEDSAISMALLDLAGFSPEIWPRCDQLREASIPFLVISPKKSFDLQKESLARGASGMLVKPVAMKELTALINAFLGE